MREAVLADEDSEAAEVLRVRVFDRERFGKDFCLLLALALECGGSTALDRCPHKPELQQKFTGFSLDLQLCSYHKKL